MRKQHTTLTRFGRKVKGSYQSFGLGVKLAAVVILGLCFVFIWSVFSPSSYSITYQRENFDDIREPISAANRKKVTSLVPSNKKSEPHKGHVVNKEDKKLKHRSSSGEKKKKFDGSLPSKSGNNWHKNEKNGVDRKRKVEDLKLPKKVDEVKDQILEGSETEEEKIENKKQEEEKEVVEGKENVKEKPKNNKQEGEEDETVDGKEKEETDTNKEDEEGGVDGNEEGEGNGELTNSEELDQEVAEKVEDEDEKSRDTEKKMKKNLGPLFDPEAHYTWNLCSTKSKHNYIPCIDIESVSGKLRNFRHRERSCLKASQMCLVPLPPDGYETPVSWPESKLKILYKNVAHPKLAAFVKTESWVVESGEYLTFPLNQSMPKGGSQHYLDFIEEMVPDIEWGKNIRVVLDIGCKDSSFGASLLEKGVLTLTLGLKDDLVDLAQVALERGFPAVVTPFGTRRHPFPSGVFDAIHCSDCHASWHSNGGKHLIEMNRILRPGGYFILSSKHSSIEVEEAMSTLTASICWNILADKTDEISDIRIKLYQKPQANDIYQSRRKKVPPLCKANENPDASWYVPIKSCLHRIPESIEQRGTEWPEEWPKRLETFPDWMNNREKLIADSEHWNAVVNNSYLVGLGIDWSNIRNVMDMKAINGGFAAALAQHKVWVMNVIPVHAPNTLPIVFERGLVGVYHDWCEAFGTYPRSYDLLHADHLFSRLKNRCKHPIVIVVEMDRILRPGGWAIIRDKVEILDPLESILRSLHWEIRMTFAKDKEGILCAQKTMWRP
ncbi:probable methyltransferase PMT28 [Nicotiana sylvestris]|uniref:Probable methyltransferase PMT28 n=2 Tax=Nicotiana TaxID=4085 RepID=A0A1S4B6Y9_TOBAC|nr:PREDICTED: probable methyltransferase PMT28 [Nicotiana sylvestris]XP_016484558.1 PREDICTED: probable methyltransferase PMT28 [Nicotiana tabacum]